MLLKFQACDFEICSSHTTGTNCAQPSQGSRDCKQLATSSAFRRLFCWPFAQLSCLLLMTRQSKKYPHHNIVDLNTPIYRTVENIHTLHSHTKFLTQTAGRVRITFSTYQNEYGSQQVKYPKKYDVTGRQVELVRNGTNDYL